MDSLSTVLNMVRQKCYMASTDLADAYYIVPVLFMDQKYLQFQSGEIYINTHAHQMTSHPLQEYLPKY